MKRAASKSAGREAMRKAKNVTRTNDPIRIVPLHLPSEIYRPSIGIAAAPAAQLTYRGGPLLVSVKVFTIFWGPAWTTNPNSGLADQMNHFFRFVVSSALVDQLAEYSVPGITIGHGSFAGSATVTSPDPGTSVDDSGIQKLVQDQIQSDSSILQAGPNSRATLRFPSPMRTLSTSSTCRREPRLCRVDRALARRSAAITTPLAKGFTML